MQLSSRTCPGTCVASRSSVQHTPSRHTVVARAADTASSPFAGLLRIFTPDKYIDSKENWEGTGSGFQGKISRGRRPFKDGYSAGAQKQGVTQKKATPGAKAAAKPEAGGNGSFMDYLSAAAQRVVGNNFSGDATEPDWGKLGAGSRGWSGDVKRGRKKI